jgi:acetyl esterase/lipase
MRYIAAMISIATLLGAAAPAAAEPMTYAEFKTLAQPTGGEKIVYGPAASQFVRLWTPAGPGPYPVAIMLHGGCWQHEVADLDYMNAAALDLSKRGIAVWDIEYRRVDEAGGGYPGTFQDVATAVDLLRTEGPRHRLDLKRVAATGHSAGGHLALWAAGRANLPASSPLYKADPLPISTVISIAGLPNLQGAPDAIALVCGENIVGRLTGPASPAHADVFADTSPLRLLPLHVPVVMVHGTFDSIAPPWHGSDYRKAAKAKGDDVAVVVVPEAGHFELVWPGAEAWGQVAGLLQKALKP